MPDFSLTQRQQEANALLASPATHVMLFGGSRSGKTFLIVRALVVRALKAPGSRHAILRFRFNAIVSSVVFDTFPKVMELCFPGVAYEVNRSQWFVSFPNGSEIWFGGLDDKERTEKILGNEYSSIFLNECSQIPWSSRNVAVTRLAQKAIQHVDGLPARALALKMYYDENPPDRGHWTYRLFVQKTDPETRAPLSRPDDVVAFQVNPASNAGNLPDGYLSTLQGLSARMRRRFWDGEFREANPSALFLEDELDRWRILDGKTPDMQRVIVAVDPSGSGDIDNQDNDEIGICVVGLGTDGNAYVIEDLTVKAGPATWGKVATTAYERHAADAVVAEVNFGGAMVAHVIKTSGRVNYKEVRASRGKVVRAEPIASLVELGKIRLVGYFPKLEEELAGFTSGGYTGEGSPNRADAMIWGLTELFPGLTRREVKSTYDFAKPPSGGALIPTG